MFLLVILISILEFSFSFKCGHDKIKKIPKIINNSLVKNNTNRRLDTYHPKKNLLIILKWKKTQLEIQLI